MKRMIMAAMVAMLLATACQGNVFSLEVGQCFNEPDGTEVSSVETVDCAEAHDNEVYHLFDLPDGDFPGNVAVQSDGAQGCLDAFEGYVGAPYETSVYDIRALFPTADSWDSADDREIVCYLVLFEGGTTTGSARNSGR